MGRVEGKVAFVTGAASGIGEGIARLFAAEGAKVIVADIDENRGPVVAGEIENAIFVAHDVAREDDWKSNIDAAMRRFGKLDILVNVAGVTAVANIEDETFAQWKRLFSINADGAFFACKYGVGAMRQCGVEGSIVIVSSPMAIRTGSSMVSYSASKGVGLALIKSVALHCAEQKTGIRCNGVLPGTVHTGVLEAYLKQVQDREKALREAVSMMPINRLCGADEVAYAALYLGSDESKIVTGTTLAADGAYLIA